MTKYCKCGAWCDHHEEGGCEGDVIAADDSDFPKHRCYAHCRKYGFTMAVTVQGERPAPPAAPSWQRRPTENVSPEYDGATGIPLCSETCPSHDGKRCRILGFRPERICEPAVVDLVANPPECMREHAGDAPREKEHAR